MGVVTKLCPVYDVLLFSDYSIFLLFPFGAGAICGVEVYVTVLVTVSLTSRTLERVFGDLVSQYLPPRDEKSQSKGDRALLALNGDRNVVLALRGESRVDVAGDWGILNRPSRAVVGAEDGYANDAGADVVVEEVTGDVSLCSQLQEQSLCSLVPVEGADVGVVWPDDLLSSTVAKGLNGSGLMVLRKSKYATGGVMGVFMLSSCLMKSEKPGKGLRAETADNSDGKVEIGNVAVIGVLS